MQQNKQKGGIQWLRRLKARGVGRFPLGIKWCTGSQWAYSAINMTLNVSHIKDHKVLKNQQFG